MEGYNRFFTVELLVIGLVGVYAENRGDLLAQQSKESSLLTIENASAQHVAEYIPRILNKRSNPQRPLDLSIKNPAIRQAAEADRMRQNAQRSRNAQSVRKEQQRLESDLAEAVSRELETEHIRELARIMQKEKERSTNLRPTGSKSSRG